MKTELIISLSLNNTLIEIANIKDKILKPIIILAILLAWPFAILFEIPEQLRSDLQIWLDYCLRWPVVRAGHEIC